ncbi:MAG: carboxypeptidase regulatory-like domain-containing protein, partial [Thermoplasmatales archaeon]|nr:carboxypeptidase regulatory-like domain-containing protein [Thermoplasmatales archaeon]
MIKKKIYAFIVLGMMVGVMFFTIAPKIYAQDVRVDYILKGYVTDMETNETLEGIRVEVHAEMDDYHDETTTNSLGYYEFYLSQGTYHISAWDNEGEYCQFWSEGPIKIDYDTWFNISLRKKPPENCILKGYVRDSETGDGIGKAWVNVWDEMGYNTWTETKSYPAGYFEVNTANGSLKVRANKENYLGTEERVVMVDYQVTWQNFTLIYAPENSVVKGYVKDLQTGMPIPNLWINVNNRWNWGRSDETDAAGYYEMSIIAGKLWLDVWKEGYYSNETEFDIAEGETKWINIIMYKELSENATICGYINDTTGNPISNARVRAYGYGDWENETWTNSMGYYTMDVVATVALNVNLTLLVTADQHGSNTTTFSVDDGETKPINLNLEKDINLPEIDFNIMPTGNISTNNPAVINGTIKEKYLRECSIYLAQYKETQGSQRAYVLRAFYRYTEEEEDGWGLEEELILTPTGEPDTYNFSMEWDATTEGGWVEYDGIKEYVIPSWYNLGQFNVEGKYYNNTNPTPRDGQASFNKITGKLDCINIHGDMGMEIYPEDDPTSMFAPSQRMLFFDVAGQPLGGEETLGTYFSVTNVAFEYDSKVPTEEYAALIFAKDYGDSENFTTAFIHIDNTNPEIESISITPESPLNASTATFTILFSETVNQSVRLNVSFGLALPYTNHTITGAWQTSATWQGTYLITNTTGDGVNTIRVENVEDSAKNPMDPDTSKTFIIDTTKPILEILSPVNNTITNQSVTLNYSVSDNIDSPEDVVVNIENGTVFSDEGNFTIIINATDRAGNIAIESVSFVIDKTPPSITITNVTNNSYYDVSVTPIVETKDMNLDTSTITLNGASFTSNTTIPEEGAYTLRVETLDKASNRATETILFTIDKTKPIANAGGNKTIDQGTTLTLSGSASTDINGSGIINYTLEFNGVTYYSEEVNHTFHSAGSFTFTLTVKDAAGNWDVDTVIITVNDIAKPVIVYTSTELTDQPKGKSIEIEVEVTDNVGIANVTLYYRSLNEAEWKSLPMVKGINNIWSGTILGEDVTDDIFYYFVATDTSGNNVTKPTDGKENPYKIPVLVGGGKEGIGGWQSGILGIIAVAIIAALGLFGFVYYKKKPKETGKKVEEVKKIEPRKVKYNRGSCYIIREQTPETSFKVFSDFVKKGAPGLCISRTNPEEIKEKHKLKNVELLWLTTGREDEHSINPTHIEKMTWTIKEFIKNNRNSAVLLDGVEYLIVQNNFLTILKSLQALEDAVSINKSILIIPISPMAISEKEM